jgi:sugar-specific transcriptional regulator TrmB
MKDSLIQLGLTEREADAYLALYNFKEATANELAKITKEHRTNIYDSLNELIKKGLIAYTIKNNVRYFHVSHPERLLDYIQEKENIAIKLVPQLQSKIQSNHEKPIVEVYEGKEGFKSILSIILKENQTIYGIGASEEWEKQFPIKFDHYMKERENKKIYAKLLYIKGSKPVKNKMNEYKFLPLKYSQPPTITIFGDYVAVFMWTEPIVATLTKSKELSNSFKRYFNFLWKIAKR